MTALRQRIARLEQLQAARITRHETFKAEMDALVEVRQREIDNLRAMLTGQPALFQVAT